MNLQEKTIAVLMMSLIAVIIFIIVFVSGMLISSYTTLENRYVENSLDRVHSAISDETALLSTRVTEWAPWDDTYYFVNGEKPGYIETNLVPDTFSNIRVNVIVIANRQGDILYAGAYDLQNKTMVPVPETVLALTNPESPVMRITDPQGAITGILQTPGSPIFIAARPVVHTDYSGTPQGVVIMGKYLDSAEIQRFSTLSQSSLRMIRVDDPALSPEILDGLLSDNGKYPDMIQPVDNDKINGYTLVRDMNGNEAFVLELSQPRDIYQQGLTTTRQFIFTVLAACALFGIAILILIDRNVLSRIGSLSYQVHRIGTPSTLSRRVKIGGNDELASLATEINRMLADIEKTHTSLLKSESRFRELAELLPQIIFEMDAGGMVTYLNRAGLSVGQLTETDISRGLNARDLFLPEELPKLQSNLQRLSAGERLVEATYLFVRRDGTTFPGNTYVSPILSEGTHVGFRGIIVDITEQKKMEDALAESREYLNQIFASVNVGILVIAADTHTIIDVNTAAARMIEASKQDIVGKRCHHVVCPSSEGHCPITDDHMVFENTERVLITADGKSKPIIKHVVKINLHGRPCMLETFIDNTDRKLMEDTLRENQAMLSGILQGSPVGVFRLDTVGNMLFINEMWTTITGYTISQLTGNYWERILHPDDCKRALNEILTARRECRMIRIEIRFIRSDGSVVWVYEQMTPLVDEAHNLTGWVGTITDITERKKVEDELAESEEKYRALAENTADILYSIDLQGVITYISSSVNRYGFLVDEILSHPFTGFIHPDDRASVKKNFMEEMQAGKLGPSRFRIVDAWGYIHWIEESSTLRVNAFGEVIGLYGVLRDITEGRQAEEAIRLANKKLNLLSSITRHDILNLITGLLGCTDMAKEVAENDQCHNLLDDITSLTRKIEDQITFTRDYQDVGVKSPIWQNIAAIVNSAGSPFKEIPVRIENNVNESFEVFADPLLEKVFYNLVDNAIRYGETITMIRFYLQQDDDGLTIVCEDDGMGVPNDAKDHIFERGYGKHTGLGLFLANEILSITGLTMEETGTYGSGARFEIHVPCVAARYRDIPQDKLPDTSK